MAEYLFVFSLDGFIFCYEGWNNFSVFYKSVVGLCHEAGGFICLFGQRRRLCLIT